MSTLVSDQTLSEKPETEKRSTLQDLPIQVVGGCGTYSYFKNSFYQRLATDVSKEQINDVVTSKLDVKSLASSSSNTIRLIDCGCAVGPNTVNAMEDLIEIVKHKYKSQCPNSEMPEFQVFYNDQSSNDFNTLFTSIPEEKQYFVAGVPGSFHKRLFPEKFLHIVHASYALHWLSKVPKDLTDKNSPAWNKGRIHYAFAPQEVLKAYSNQFDEDFESFLNARAKEIVPGGIMVITNPSIPDGMPFSEIANGLTYNCMGNILCDMAKAGLLSQDEVDAFNVAIYSCPPGELSAVVERNGNFTIEIIGLTNPSPWLKGRINMPEFVKHVRAATEGMFNKHFPREITDEMFRQLVERLEEINDTMVSCYRDGVQLFAVLQRK